MIFQLQRKLWRIIYKRKIEMEMDEQIKHSNKSRMSAEQPDYSKLPKQFQFGVEKGKTINLFEKSGDFIDGKKQIAHLIDTVVLLNSRLIEEVEERTRLQKRNQTCEECCAGWADLSVKQNERIGELCEEVVKGAEAVVELKKELAELKEKMKFLDLDGKPCDRCNEPVCYEGNEGKISKRDDAVICGECFSREGDEDADWECEYCEKVGLYDQEGMIEKSIFPNGDWSETVCWCNQKCFGKWVRRMERQKVPLEEYAHYLKDD